MTDNFVTSCKIIHLRYPHCVDRITIRVECTATVIVSHINCIHVNEISSTKTKTLHIV